MHFLGSAKIEPTRTNHSKSIGKETDAPQKKGKHKRTAKRAGGRKKGEYSSKCNNSGNGLHANGKDGKCEKSDGTGY